MAAKETAQLGNYTQGHSESTVATHLRRTADLEAAFVLPYITKTARILDVGCGPGTITTGFAKYASEGTTTGIDNSAAVLQKAKALAAEANLPTEGPGSVTFIEGDVLKRLPYPDDTFDIVFSSQCLGHLPPPDLPRQAIVEMRRVLKPGGVLATRDAAAQHFYPHRLRLDQLWVQNFARVVLKGSGEELTGPMMPRLFRLAGFDTDGGKVRVGTSSTAYSSPEARKWLAQRATGQLSPGDPFRQSWLDAGISEGEIEETLAAAAKWAETDDAWFASLHCEMLAWK